MSVYIQLFHGRKDPDATMDDWGETGPTLGPLTYVQMTYFQTIRLGLPNGDDGWLTKVDDLVYYDGMYYGDIDIVSSKNDRDINTRKAKEFDEKLALRDGDKRPEESSGKKFECSSCGDILDVSKKSKDGDEDECVYCTGEDDRDDNE